MSAVEVFGQSNASSLAMVKAVSSVAGSVQRHLDDLKAPWQLEPGEYVRLAFPDGSSEWVRFVSVNEFGWMRVYRPDSACEWTYEPTAGELFVWHEGAF